MFRRPQQERCARSLVSLLGCVDEKNKSYVQASTTRHRVSRHLSNVGSYGVCWTVFPKDQRVGTAPRPNPAAWVRTWRRNPSRGRITRATVG